MWSSDIYMLSVSTGLLALTDYICRFTHPATDLSCRDNITTVLQSSARGVFATRSYSGPELSSFQPVTVDKVRRLLFSMPSKSSPLYVLPYSVLSYVPTSCQTCQPADARWSVPVLLQEDAGVASAKEGWAQQSFASK